jgi:dihydroxy-acid dehydratase
MKKISSDKISKALKILGNIESHRFYWKASGYIDEDLERPIVAIANSKQDAGVGHMHLGELSRNVKESVYAAGGTPIEFNVIGPCAGYAKTSALDDISMLYDLPQRESIADTIEIQMKNYNADGLVCICTCDKIVPGMWLASARLNLPTIFLLGGPAQPGCWRDQEIVFPTNIIIKGLNMVLSGEMSEDDFSNEMQKMESKWIRGCGACPELTTANTTMISTEAMGLCLPGVATTPGNAMEKIRQSRKTGHAIMQLIQSNIRFKDIVTKSAIKDAVRIVMAISGSTNGILHLLSLTKTMDLNLTLEDFQEISDSTPYISPLRPSGKYSIVDFHEAGGVLKLMKILQHDFDLNRLSVTGYNLNELLQNVTDEPSDVIRKKTNAIYPSGGIVVMKGNLAPKGALMRHTIMKSNPEDFSGPAKCFNTQKEALLGILSGKVDPGDVMIIRYQGPRGAPGFSENFKIVLLLDALGLNDVAVVADSRFSGATEGALYVGYVSPEAYVSGPIASVKNGDQITISLEERRVDVNLTPREIKERLREATPPKLRIKEGILIDWRRNATQFHEGAMLTRKL